MIDVYKSFKKWIKTLKHPELPTNNLPNINLDDIVMKIDEDIEDIIVYTDRFNYPKGETQHYRLGKKDGLEKAKNIILEVLEAQAKMEGK